MSRVPLIGTVAALAISVTVLALLLVDSDTPDSEVQHLADTRRASILVPRHAESSMPSAPTSAVTPFPASVESASDVGDAAATMADARLHGDDRAPPIDDSRAEPGAPQPTAWELIDRQAYREYEQREQQRVRSAYVEAAAKQLTQWQAALAEARARGLPVQDIAAAEEKVRRLEAARASLVQPGGGTSTGSRSEPE